MRKRVKVSFYNIFEPQAEEERNHSQSRAEEKRSYKIIKNSKPRTDRGAEYQFVKNLKSRAKRGKEQPQTSCERDKKPKKKTLNLVRKRGRTSIYQESRISCGGGRERYLRSRMKK